MPACRELALTLDSGLGKHVFGVNRLEWVLVGVALNANSSFLLMPRYKLLAPY